MKPGSELAVLRDSIAPAKSPNTRLVAAARASSFHFGTEKPFLHALEEVGGKIQRTVTWLMNGAEKVEFLWVTVEPDGSLKANREHINFNTFRARYIDLEWVKANPDHPISYLRAAHKMHVEMVNEIKDLPHSDIIRKGKRTAQIPSDATPEMRAKILKGLNGN